MIEELNEKIRDDKDFAKASPAKRGSMLEDFVKEHFKDIGFKAWRPPKAKYRSQDILRAFDVIAVNTEEIVLIQVCSSSIPKKKEEKVKSVPVPPCCRRELWCWRTRRSEPSFEIRTY